MSANRGNVTVGIDTLAIYTSRYAFELAELARARGTDVEKYHTGLGQYVMSVSPPGEDIVTMGANAARQALQGVEINDIALFLFATESGIDQSKAAGLFVHGLLGLPSRCRVVELKQACYSGTAAIQLGLSFLRDHPEKKVLVVASDIARYGLATSGESSQGSAAVALVLSADPRVLAVEPEYGVAAENVMDFWRPNYLHEALVDGKYSSKLYLVMLEKSWQHYQSESRREFSDHAYFCYHTPVPRLVEKAHQHLLKINHQQNLPVEDTQRQIQYALEYGRKTGNSYSASLYLGLASLLDHAEEDLGGKRIGFYSYGSGCVAEYFSGTVRPGYRGALHSVYHAELLANRKRLNYEEYEQFFRFSYAEDGCEQEIPLYDTGGFRLARMRDHKRVYEVVEETQARSQQTERCASSDASESAESVLTVGRTLRRARAAVSRDERNTIRVIAPGKLILSGEHAVVYGSPALAMAVNRYVTATVTREQVPQVLFDLSDLSHRSRLSVDALHHLKNKIKQKYYRFIRGDFSIRDVLQKPFELAQFAIGMLTESLNLTLPHGVKIQVQSDLPIGCGMGSSAATIVSVMQAISSYMELPVPQEQLFKLALEVENMQHGYSSGLDLRVAMQGGCIYMRGQTLEPRSIPSLPMYLINTGSPESSTGHCVESVAPYFKSGRLGEEFTAVTTAMDTALKQQAWRGMQEAIRGNHRLLTDIGVVPERVRKFVSLVEAAGGAAKICGAGSVTGDKAGAVLVVSDDQQSLASLSSRFGYNVIPISCEPRGVYAA
ncbi:Hydroxymethylglutaryl-CoA synthase [Aquicella siphonis]|uniref:mevalonate kinase n=1 Tax=Aquicella siphonis TaxID=254247 RepID=A0A5E4PIZ4_9COXI|nr:hydroxymethylglutaryl-CoA synthase [Aquicella siphonis]VVC76545.1 Hydroxymethylglutaryl-CoA synthase [Aquicella siphonis]